MSIIDKLLGPVGDVLSSAIDKIAGDKMDEGDKARLQLETQKMVRDALQAEEATFRQFVLDYEGAARDMPRFIQVLRGSVRPVLTYTLVGFFMYAMAVNWEQDSIAMIFKLNLLTCFFWFGEKAVRNTGLMDMFKGGSSK